MIGYCAGKDLEKLESNLDSILDNEELQKELTVIMLSGLKRLGFKKSLKSLEVESGIELPRPFGEDFREYVLQGRFDQAIGAIKDKAGPEDLHRRICYELLRLKYVKCLIAKDNITALYLLRNELNQYSEWFSLEQKELSQLFLCRSKKALISKSGIDVESQEFLLNFLKKLENKNMGNEDEDDNSEGIFEEFVKRYLAYEVINCKFHSPGSHQLFNFKNTKTDKPNEKKTKKISKKSNTTDPISRSKKTRRRHLCKNKTMNLQPVQSLKNPTNQVWRVKLSANGQFLVASTKDNSLYCWKKE